MNVAWKLSLAVWWSAAWRGLLWGLGFGFVLGFIAGIIAAVSGVPEKARVYGGIAGYLGSIPASMIAMRQALSKHLKALSAAAAASAA